MLKLIKDFFFFLENVCQRIFQVEIVYTLYLSQWFSFLLCAVREQITLLFEIRIVMHLGHHGKNQITVGIGFRDFIVSWLGFEYIFINGLVDFCSFTAKARAQLRQALYTLTKLLVQINGQASMSSLFAEMPFQSLTHRKPLWFFFYARVQRKQYNTTTLHKLKLKKKI